jgi:DNA modification methylase
MITWVEIKRVQPNPNNPRAIRDARFEKLKQSIIDFPEMLEKRPLVCYTEGKNYIVLGGNMRLKALQDIGHGEVPIMLADDWTEEQRAQFLIKDNVGFGEWDWNTLANEWDAEKLEAWGLELPPMDAIELAAEEDNYEMPNELQTDIVLGDLFDIGEHRLLCGDSTDSDQVAKLMDGEKADMVFTDPPYGYSYESNYQKKHKELLNDDKILDFLPNVYLFSKDNIAIYLFCGWQTIKEWILEVEKNSFDLKNIIIWKKNNWSMGDLKGAYAGQYEVMLFLHKGRIQLKNGRGQDVWEFDRVPPKKHPTMKPIQLIEKALKDTTENNNLVLDLFLGSGSTMVAAHQLKRKCYGIELDPKYCQVIIDRMIKLDPTLEIKRNGQPYKTAK